MVFAPTLVWCILRKISCEWFWMLQQGFQALHWMICIFLDPKSSLLEVLHRFRHDRVAFISDLECMLYQVKVPALQCDLLRSLWWPGGDIPRRWLNVACTRIFLGQPVHQLSPLLLFTRQLLTMLTFSTLRPWKRWGDRFMLMIVWSRSLQSEKLLLLQLSFVSWHSREVFILQSGIATAVSR